MRRPPRNDRPAGLDRRDFIALGLGMTAAALRDQ